MKLGICQIKVQLDDVDGNCRKMLEYVQRASEMGCELVAFPEMSDTGYDMPTIMRTASTWDNGPVQELVRAAIQFHIAIVAGVSERDESGIYNSIAVIGTDGKLITKYRKTHLITAAPVFEHHYLGKGNSLASFQLGELKFGLMTCYDIRFPELARTLVLSGVDVLLVPSAFPLLRVLHWRTLTACRAIENQVYLAAPNRTGVDGTNVFAGTSRIIDPYGTILSASSEIDESILVADLTKQRVLEVRDKMKIFQDRREDLYSRSNLLGA